MLSQEGMQIAQVAALLMPQMGHTTVEPRHERAIKQARKLIDAVAREFPAARRSRGVSETGGRQTLGGKSKVKK